jgi:hypothetical protein
VTRVDSDVVTSGARDHVSSPRCVLFCSFFFPTNIFYRYINSTSTRHYAMSPRPNHTSQWHWHTNDTVMTRHRVVATSPTSQHHITTLASPPHSTPRHHVTKPTPPLAHQRHGDDSSPCRHHVTNLTPPWHHDAPPTLATNASRGGSFHII